MSKAFSTFETGFTIGTTQRMQLKKLSLINYKNFENISFDFDSKINCLVGENGIGKTNVLDSIYQLAYGKSYFNPITSQNIHHDADFFVVDGEFIKKGRVEKVVVSIKKGNKKIIKRNGKAYDRLREHIGLIPVVLISPADRDLIMEGSHLRRKFMDGIIAQSDATYLQQLLRYNKVIEQRNALLKFFAANGTFNSENLAIYDHELTGLGAELFEKRKDFIAKFLPLFINRYAQISNRKEEVSIAYKSQLLEEDLAILLQNSVQKDLQLQYTSQGIHKDDLKFKIGHYPVKKFGSQGQQKSFLIALKLAQYDFMKNQLSTSPILLFDDIFDKLDEQRVLQLIKLVTQEDLGQIFISDTHRERTEHVVKHNTERYQIIELQ